MSVARSERIPTILAADPNAAEWGPFIRPGAQTLTLLKLTLPHEEDLPDHPAHSSNLDEVREAIRVIRHVAGMKGVSVVAKYLSCLWNACKSRIAEEYTLSEDMTIRIVFTIPATWREDAIARMRDAILASGILNIGRSLANMEFLTESEAAALSVLPRLAGSRRCKVLMSPPTDSFSSRIVPEFTCHQLQNCHLDS